MPVESDAELRELLGLRTVAVVGCSSTPGKDAHEIPRYLTEHGYDVIPVNPNADEILDERAYDSLSAVEEEIDIVDVFRPSEEVAGIVDETLERDDAKVLWLQLGISDPDAEARAEEAGIHVVPDRCMKVEHQRLHAP
ncbi:CoA-binding protein [Halalkalicoccus tibetensis]|uniref:CoA-binding protein n=1 Tax=Halalkalicoccus tibetensis TaxID=175632 RepID=A0ABD5V5A2_9EURY